MDERYIAAIDLGSHKIAVSVAEVSGQNVQFIYYNEVPSMGIRYSEVQNLTRASEQVNKLISKAEQDLKINILQAVINLPRWKVRQETATASLVRSDAESPVSQEEIDFLKADSRSFPLKDENKEEIYGIIVQNFSTDDYIQAAEEEIVGMVSETLEGSFKAYVGDKRKANNAERILNLNGRSTAFKVFTPEHTANAVLSDEEKMNGVALVELGAEVTSVSVFYQGVLRYYSSIPFGGRNISDDIRIECGISDKLAENIKLAYGACMPDRLQTLKDKVIQIDNPSSGMSKQLTVKYLSEIITARLHEIIQAVLYMIQESGLADTLISGAVLTGGVAQTANIASYFKELSGYDVRIGYPLRNRFTYSECPDISEASSASIVGMILHAKEDRHLNCLSGKMKENTEKKSFREDVEGSAERQQETQAEANDGEGGLAEWFSTEREEVKAEKPSPEDSSGTEPNTAEEDTGKTEKESPAEKEDASDAGRQDRKRKPKRESGLSRFGNIIWKGLNTITDKIDDFAEDTEE